MSRPSATALLLNTGHAIDHLFLLIFATAVAAIATGWGMLWQDLMPYTVGAVALFGLGSLPAGRLGDLWGRRAMMIVFFIGMGLSAVLIATATGVWHLAVALTVMGAFASIYVDDRIRSRVAGIRLAISFGVASGAVYLLGPVVKASGFTTLLLVMAGISALTTIFVSLLPGAVPRTVAIALAPAPAGSKVSA